MAGTAFACDTRAPTEPAPELEAIKSAALSVSPTALQFAVPRAMPTTVTVSAQSSGEITAVVEDGACASVLPPSVVGTRPVKKAPYQATFEIRGEQVGVCQVTFRDRRGNQAHAAVTVVQSEVGPDPKSIAAGVYHTCAVGANGTTYCWGRNDNGRLGDGTTTHRAGPTPVFGNPGFTSLAAGDGHTCGLRAPGDAWCWGRNGSGQLGDGTQTDRLIPTAVVGPEGGAPLAFVLLVAGNDYTCGLTEPGRAWCWGRHADGPSDGLTPLQVPGGQLFSTLSAQGLHTCGVTSDGTAYCWGENEDGQLGDGTTNTGVVMPTLVSGGLRFTSIAAGGGGSGVVGEHTCGTTSGSAYCWGNNAYGQLGDASNTGRLTPAAVTAPGFESLALGTGFTCSLDGSGAAHCWGHNISGQLGTGNTTDLNTPGAVAAPEGGEVLAFTQLEAGVAHVCGRAASGELWCWGLNSEQQLGIGSGGAYSRPTLVPLGSE